jgi:hypothetical protein
MKARSYPERNQVRNDLGVSTEDIQSLSNRRNSRTTPLIQTRNQSPNGHFCVVYRASCARFRATRRRGLEYLIEAPDRGVFCRPIIGLRRTDH